MLSPPSAPAAQYNLTVGQVITVRQYMHGLVITHVAPIFKANVLGELGGPDSAGLVVARTVGDWIDGEISNHLITPKCSI